MAQVHYVFEGPEDYAQCYLFKNKKKADAKAAEIKSAEDFMEDVEDGVAFLEVGSISYKEGFAVLLGSDFWPGQVKAMSADEFNNLAQADEDGAFVYYTGSIKDGTECYLDQRGNEYNGTQPTIAVADGDYEIGESVKTTFKYVPTFESFIGSQKLNEDTDWDACEGAQKDKFATVCKALKCEYSDLVFFELLHNELDYYTEEEYNHAFEKDQKVDFTKKDFVLKKIDEDGDPHGNMDGVIVNLKGTKLKYAYFDSDMNYSGTICSKKDIKALEAFYLDGKKASTKDGVQNPTEMSDVYGEYCMDMGFENEDE